MTGYYTFSVIWNRFPRQPTNWAEIWDLSTGKEMQRIYAMIRPRNGTDRMVMNKKQKRKKTRCITCCVFSHWDDSAQIKQTTVLYHEAKRGVVFLSFLVPNIFPSFPLQILIFFFFFPFPCDTLQYSKAISPGVGVFVRRGGGAGAV